MGLIKIRAWYKPELELGVYRKFETVYSHDTVRFEHSYDIWESPYTQDVGHVLASDDWLKEPATGLLTKDGADIYVGDFVEFGDIIGEVQFLPQQNGYAVITHNSDYKLECRKYNVIGNIHEDKGMLQCHIKWMK